MCDFTDRDGNVLEVNDEILYWSSKSKDWFKAKVCQIVSIRKAHFVANDNGGGDRVPVTKTKIKVAKWNVHQNRYLTCGYVNLTKPESIRKV